MPREKLRILAEGVFFPFLNYCIQVYGHILLGQTEYNEQQIKSIAFTKDDNRRLQIMVNNVLRAMTGLDNGTPVDQLIAVDNYQYIRGQPSTSHIPVQDHPVQPAQVQQ